MNLLSIVTPLELPKRASLALIPLRLVAGSAMMLHGLPKIQSPFSWMPPEAGMPGFLLFLAALSEFGGGIAWILGLLTPIASFGIFCTMSVAAFLVHMKNGDPFVSKGGPSYELALLYFAIAILFILMGPGRYSLDALLSKRRQQKLR